MGGVPAGDGRRRPPRHHVHTGVGDRTGPLSLPRAADRRVAIRVTKDAERQLRGGHPWIYDGSIVHQSHEASSGDLAVVFDSKRKFLAIGLYDADSPIRIKVLQHRSQRTIDVDFWHERVAEAARIRAPLLADGRTTGYRLVNGENDGLSGLIVDCYADTAVIKLYSAAWFAHLDDVLQAVQAATASTRVVLRLSRLLQRGDTFGLRDGDAIVGTPPDGPVVFFEHGLEFEADVVGGQKTGHFLDQRENRREVARRSSGARVLDVFSCTAGFAVHAAAGGAATVHRIDISPSAIATGGRNIARNPTSCVHTSTTIDAFEGLAQLASERRRFDIVVIDPPSFAKRQTERTGALEAYARLTNAGLAVLEPGGLLVQASCSSRIRADEFVDTVTRAAQRSGRPLDIETRTGHAIDHPVSFPEGDYLKALFARA